MKIGNLNIDKPIVLAPMEDVTETAFRLICRRMGADIVYTEFTSSEALIRNVDKAKKKIMVTEAERPVAIQIFGGVPSSMEEATKVVESFHPDFVDINCGCWVKKVAMRSEGAGLLKDLPRFEEVVKATVKATKLPVTVKTRLGWDEKSIVILDVAKMVEDAGAKALTIHCRTRDQAHGGQADWGWLEKIKKKISIPLIGNGDVMTPQDVKGMFETGCDGVMIGRGAIGNPWIFQQAKHFLKTGQYLPQPLLKERLDTCVEHLKLSVQFKGVRDGVVTFRKYYAGYLKGLPHVAHLRSDLMQMVELNQIVDRLYQFCEDKSSLVTT